MAGVVDHALRGIPRGSGRRDRHAGAGHGTDDSQHASQRQTGRRVHRGRRHRRAAHRDGGTSAGIAAVLLASEPAFVAMKIVGAAYLVLLGVQALWTALRGSPAARPEVRGRTRALTPLKAARQGFLSNIGNPKIAVFFTSLLPQFASGEGSTFLLRMPRGGPKPCSRR